MGQSDWKKRRELIAKAFAILSLSDVHETFGGVAIEGMISGTVPVVADTGGFRDTIRSGYNGFRVDVRNVEETMRAVKDAEKLDPYALRKSGLRYSMERCAIEHNAYYQNIDRELKFGDNFEPRDYTDWENVGYPEDWMIPVDADKCRA